ncbi:MAG: hypothetical protein M1820_003278 [Bogoriella megaspora]|nr:MAG: hypothetical protein M1820_003278 [Bogoriella megaspora]
MAQPTPKRIVLQFPERWFHEVGAIITIFFEMHNPNAIEDYIFNIIPANHSLTKHFLVIDLHCKTIPQVDINAIEHQVFKVSKEDRLTS